MSHVHTRSISALSANRSDGSPRLAVPVTSRSSWRSGHAEKLVGALAACAHCRCRLCRCQTVVSEHVSSSGTGKVPRTARIMPTVSMTILPTCHRDPVEQGAGIVMDEIVKVRSQFVPELIVLCRPRQQVSNLLLLHQWSQGQPRRAGAGDVASGQARSRFR